MTEEIKPALTAEEWAHQLRDMEWLDQRVAWGADEAHTDRHGIAALALYGQSFGFTMADVLNLVALADWSDAEGYMLRGVWLRDIAKRIVALLPPEGQ